MVFVPYPDSRATCTLAAMDSTSLTYGLPETPLSAWKGQPISVQHKQTDFPHTYLLVICGTPKILHVLQIMDQELESIPVPHKAAQLRWLDERGHTADPAGLHLKDRSRGGDAEEELERTTA